MRKCLSVWLGACFLVVAFMGTVTAKEYKLKINMPPQEFQSWCGLAVAEAWIEWLGGNVSQVGLFSRHPSVLNGISAGNMRDILEKETGRSFDYRNHNSQSSALDRIKTEIKNQDRPLAISANACNPNGTPRSPQGHWMLVEAVNLDKKDKEFQGAYVKDPLYNSRFASNYEVIRPRTWVKDLFTKWWIPNRAVGKEFRQSVED